MFVFTVPVENSFLANIQEPFSEIGNTPAKDLVQAFLLFTYTSAHTLLSSIAVWCDFVNTMFSDQGGPRISSIRDP